jgi:hypothetical protein
MKEATRAAAVGLRAGDGAGLPRRRAAVLAGQPVPTGCMALQFMARAQARSSTTCAACIGVHTHRTAALSGGGADLAGPDEMVSWRSACRCTRSVA